jgi:hypothetical protein
MRRIFMTSILCVGMLSALSCTKGSESNDLSQAQKCLDNIPEGDYDAANTCLAMVKDYTSQQAEILRCSIILTSGGLMEDKIIKSYNAFKNDNSQTNKTAAYMAALALTYPDVDGGYSKALQADTYCQASNVKGLQYLSGLVVAGSFMNKVAGSIDITDPNAAQNAINTLITDCVTSPQSSCTDNIDTLGGAVENLANSYCNQSNADPNVCNQVTGAIDSSGGTTDAAGRALLCYLSNKTYITSDGQCH